MSNRPDAVILFGHGSRDPAWAAPLERLRERIASRAGAPPVTLAFLEFMSPTLAVSIDAAVAAGARRVRIAPVFLGQGAHTRRDLAALVDAARAKHPALAIELAPALGEDDRILAALADWASAAAD